MSIMPRFERSGIGLSGIPRKARIFLYAGMFLLMPYAIICNALLGYVPGATQRPVGNASWLSRWVRR